MEFLSKDFPTTKNEAWKYTSLSKFLPEKGEVLTSPNSGRKDLSPPQELSLSTDWKYLYFLNGELRGEKISPSTQIQWRQNQAGLSTEEVLKNLFKNTSTLELTYNDPNNDTLVLIHHYVDTPSHSYIPQKNHLKLEKKSKLKVIEIFVSDSLSNCQSLQETSFELKEETQLEYIKIQNLNEQMGHIGTSVTKLSENATANAFTFSLGGKLGRHFLHYQLNGLHARASLDGLMILKDSEHGDLFSFFEHLSPETYSDQLVKTLIDNQARGVFTGKVLIDRDAQRVDASQLNKNILLSKKAHINTRPQLEVYADDVKCGHGATIGQLNEEEIFYLSSRGITPERAKHMLFDAFLSETLMKISCPKISTWLEGLIREKIAGGENSP